MSTLNKILKELDLEFVNICDLSLFDDLKYLVHLSLQGNDIQDMDRSFIEQHPKLKFLSIYENEILTKKLMLPYWWDYFLSENCLDDVKDRLNSEWYQRKYGK